MYIAPDTNIWLLHGCPLDSGYENTIIFDTPTSQRAWFTEFEKITLAGYTYQRVGLNTLRVGVPTAQIYDVNYMIFQNRAYSDKYFYAFIERVEYINDNVTEIRYKIDDFQSFLFDYTLSYSFIERAHASTDEIGENTIPENLETGEYICQTIATTTTPTTARGDGWCVPVFISSVDLSQVLGAEQKPPQTYGWMVDGLFSGVGLYYYGGLSTWVGEIPPRVEATLRQLDEWGIGSAILGVIMVPAALIPGISTISENFRKIDDLNDLETVLSRDDLFSFIPDPTPGGEPFVPKNNKLFTAPFYKLIVSNNSGKSQEFAFELLNSDKFISKMAASPASPYLVYPVNYAGKSIECALSMDGVAQCTWNNDTYKNWLAQNQNSMTANIISGSVTAGAGTLVNAAAGNVAGVAGSALSLGLSVYQTLAQLKDRQAVPMATNGTVAGAVFLASQGMYKPTFLLATVRPEYARIIDNYFTRFGYAQHVVDIPNREAREHFTYVKTAGCTLHGIFESGDIQTSVPAEVETALMNIYNKGVTIWRNVSGDEFGDYSLSNKPRGVTEAMTNGES